MPVITALTHTCPIILKREREKRGEGKNFVGKNVSGPKERKRKRASSRLTYLCSIFPPFFIPLSLFLLSFSEETEEEISNKVWPKREKRRKGSVHDRALPRSVKCLLKPKKVQPAEWFQCTICKVIPFMTSQYLTRPAIERKKSQREGNWEIPL